MSTPPPVDRTILTEADWTLEGDGITISLGAPGFAQYLRRPPVHCPRHALSVEERGGFSFDRRGYTPEPS